MPYVFPTSHSFPGLDSVQFDVRPYDFLYELQNGELILGDVFTFMGHDSRMQFSNPLFSLMTRTVELRLFIVGSLTLLRYLTLEVSTIFLVRLLDELNR